MQFLSVFWFCLIFLISCNDYYNQQQTAPHIVDISSPKLQFFSDGPWYTWAAYSSTTNTAEVDHDADLATAVINQKQNKKKHWDESLEYLADYCKTNGPFDGVYGFSQGVAIITNFSLPTIWKDRFHLKACPWKFAILACGGGSSNVITTTPDDESNGIHNTANIIAIPSFHIFGSKDPIKDDSHKLEQYWDSNSKTVYTHEKGHEIDMLLLHREKQVALLLTEFFDRVT